MEFSTAGIYGGYAVDNASAINLARVVAVLDADFIKPVTPTGEVDQECLIASGIGALEEALRAELRQAVTAILPASNHR